MSIDTQELRDRTLEAAAEKILQTVERITWDEAMDAARAVMELPAIEVGLLTYAATEPQR